MTLTDSVVPEGFLRFSDAVNRLAEGMWGGLRRPLPVRRIKREYEKASVNFGPWWEQAGQRLTAAAIGGKLPVYLFPDSNPPPDAPKFLGSIREPVVLPTKLLKSLVTTRNTFPDHPIQPWAKVSMRTAGGDKELYELLKIGIILVNSKEFQAWYRFERRKGRWPSQHSRRKKTGRPSVRTQGLKDAILVAMREGETTVAGLRRRLVASGQASLPSLDTLARLVDQLHRETGEPELLRNGARRR